MDKKKEVISLHSPLYKSQQNTEDLVTEKSSRDGLWKEWEIETTEMIGKL